MNDWWARHGGGATEAPNDPSSPDATDTEEVVGDTVEAFRTALRRGDEIDSATDLEDESPLSDNPSDMDSLDYFAPAFRRALGPDENKTEPASCADENGESAEDPSGAGLDYFGPAFHRALGTDDGAMPADETGTRPEADASRTDNQEDVRSSSPSLEYFAPAFRRALGNPSTSEEREQGGDEAAQGAVRRFKDAMKDVSHLARLELPSLPRSGSNLDRIGDCLFGAQHRDLAANGC